MFKPAIILCQAVTAGANPISLKKGIDATCEYLVAKLKEVARPVKGTNDIKVRAGACQGRAVSAIEIWALHCFACQEVVPYGGSLQAT